MRSLFAVGEAFRDGPGGICDTTAFEACVMAYDAWLHPVARNQLKDIALTINEVAFISMEVVQSTRQHEHPVCVTCTTMRTSANEHCCGQTYTSNQ